MSTFKMQTGCHVWVVRQTSALFSRPSPTANGKSHFGKQMHYFKLRERLQKKKRWRSFRVGTFVMVILLRSEKVLRTFFNASCGAVVGQFSAVFGSFRQIK